MAFDKEGKGIMMIVSKIIALVIVLVVVFGGWAYYTGAMETKQTIDKDTFQAVFLSNGQVYFGKLENVGPAYLVLNDVYYLQVQEIQPQPEEDNGSQIQLIRLGNEVHQPEPNMTISKDHVLFWENLKEDSRVVETIREESGS